MLFPSLNGAATLFASGTVPPTGGPGTHEVIAQEDSKGIARIRVVLIDWMLLVGENCNNLKHYSLSGNTLKEMLYLKEIAVITLNN